MKRIALVLILILTLTTLACSQKIQTATDDTQQTMKEERSTREGYDPMGDTFGGE